MSKQMTTSLLLMLGGAFWGLLWIPFRVMEDQGVEGAWPAVFGYLFGLPHRSGPTRMLGSASVSSGVMPPLLYRAE